MAEYLSAPIQRAEPHVSSLSKPHLYSTDLVVFPDLADYGTESFVDVDGLLGRCFHEDASEVFRQVTTL